MKTSASIALSLVMGALVAFIGALTAFVGALVAFVALAQSSSALPASTTAAARDVTSSRAQVALARPTRTVGPPTRQARINIPRLHLKAPIGTDLDRGPAWWPITGRPGGGDTIAIAGHRTTHTRPFYWLERVQPGDRIYIRWQGRVHAYRMSGRRILSAKNLHIADARGHELLLLSACTPRGSARQRIVVYAWPVEKDA